MLDLEILHIMKQFNTLFLHLIAKSIPVVFLRFELLLVDFRHI